MESAHDAQKVQVSMKRILSVITAAVFTALMFVGTGAAATVIKIDSADELDAIRGDLAGSYRLTADIELPSWFTPIGTASEPFAGTLDGDGHTISGLAIDCDEAALFGCIQGGEVRDLTLENVNIRGIVSAAGIAAFAVDATIEDCHVSGRVSAVYTVGGIAAYADGADIASCAFAGDAEAEPNGVSYSGGIAGYAEDCSIKDCITTGTVLKTRNSGGIAGMAVNSNIRGCTVSSDIAGVLAGGAVAMMRGGALAAGGFTGALNGVIADRATARVTEGWVKEDGSWKYLVNDKPLTGVYTLEAYQKGGGTGPAEFYFNSDGSLFTGFRKTSAGWTYYNESGSSPMLSVLGQKAVDTYVKSPKSGYISATEQGREYNYFFDENGIMYTGWHNDELTRGRWMYFGEQGSTPIKSRLGRQARYGRVKCIGNNGEEHYYMFFSTGPMFTGTNSLGTFCTEGVDPSKDMLGALLED